MIRVFNTSLVFLMLGTCVQIYSHATAEEKEAMELGGLLTVDGANAFKDWENTPSRLGRVELSANVHVEKNMEGSITLLSEDDPSSISVDQALGQWTLGQSSIIFGLQTFNLSLLSTRTISDPLILDLGELKQAGVTVLYSQNLFTYGFGISSLTTGDSLSRSDDPCAVVNMDFAPEGQLVRLGLQFSKERQAANSATNLSYGPLLLDLEALWRWKDDDGIAKGGYSAGLAWQVNSILQSAIRWDGLGDKDNPFRDQKTSFGVTITPVEHIFGAFEVALDEKDEYVFAIQMGLESTIGLPGFRRKTLAN